MNDFPTALDTDMIASRNTDTPTSSLAWMDSMEHAIQPMKRQNHPPTKSF
jgi:hypothetical protein